MRSLLPRIAGVAALAAVPSITSTSDGHAVEQLIAGDSLRDTIAAGLSSARWSVTLPERQRKVVRTLYDAHAGAALWIEGSRLGARASRLADALADAHMEGLRLDAYPLDALRTALAALTAATPPTITQLATLDIVLTSAYVALGDDLLTGQVDPGSVTRAWHIDARAAPVDSTLLRAFRNESLDSGHAPVAPPSARALYHAALPGAVARYQAGHGLVVDSIVGPNTMASLNRSAEYRTRQVAANLERHRWLPRSRGLAISW